MFMKNLVVRTIFVLTLLLALGAVFGGTNAALAHAATLPKASSSQIVVVPVASSAVHPNTNSVDCDGRTDFFEVLYDEGGATACFANGGDPVYINLPAAYQVCTGNNTGAVVWYDPARNIDVETPFTGRNGCFWITGPNANTFVDVYEVIIN